MISELNNKGKRLNQSYTVMWVFRQQHCSRGWGGGLMSLFCLEEYSMVLNEKINGIVSRVLSEVVARLFGQSILTSSQ